MINHNIFPEFEDEPDYEWDEFPVYADESVLAEGWHDLEDFDSPSDDIERWEDDCDYDPDFAGICHAVGTEDCSFWCPFHNIHFAKNGE